MKEKYHCRAEHSILSTGNFSASILGRLPFVRTGRSDWSVRKWNAQVLRTERTVSGQTGPAHEVGRNTEREKCAIRYLTASVLVRQGPVKAVSFLCSMGGQPNVYAHLELTSE